MRLLLPPPAGWAVVVTSRSWFALQGGKLHDVELLSLDDAKALLGRMLSDGGRHDLSGANLGLLAAACGRLPLAPRLAAGYLTSTSRPLPAYQKDLERALLKYLEDQEGEQSVRAVLGLSVDRLSREAGDLARPGGLPRAVRHPSGRGRLRVSAAERILFQQVAAEVAGHLDDRRGEGNHSWNLGLQYERAGDLQRAADLMQIRVGYERDTGHPDAEAHAERVAAIRKRTRKPWSKRT